MRFRYVFQLATALFILFIMVSCETQPQSEDSKASSRMTSTDEYNYLLDCEHINKILKFAMLDSEFDSVQSLLKIAGYGEPDIKGKTDGNRVILEATYPVLKGYEEKARVIANLASERISLSGCVRTDRLIGYFKMPGLQNMVDTAHDYIDILIENDEGPMGKSNPMTQVFGICMVAGLNLQEDVFSWMGNEMGCVLFKVKGKEDLEYVTSAFAVSINNKETAMDQIYNLLGIAKKVSGADFDIDEILSVRNYKSFKMHVFDAESLNVDSMELGFNLSNPAILYTNDFMFISNSIYDLEQLADNYDPGGAQDERAVFNGYIDLDALLKYSAKGRRKYSEDLKKEFADSPELFAKASEYSDKLENIIQNNKFGKLKKIVKFTPNAIIVRIEFNKSALILYDFIVESFLPFFLGIYTPYDELMDEFYDTDNVDEEIEV